MKKLHDELDSRLTALENQSKSFTQNEFTDALNLEMAVHSFMLAKKVNKPNVEEKQSEEKEALIQNVLYTLWRLTALPGDHYESRKAIESFNKLMEIK